MAPMLLECPFSLPGFMKSTVVCSDKLVVPSATASKRIKELWWLHGNPHSKKYSDPKLVSLAALIRRDGAVYRGQKAFLFPISAEPTTKYQSMTWDEFDAVTEAIALTYAYQLQREIRDGNRTQKQPTVALLGAGKTLEYFCTELALQKLGLRVLLLAESNSSEATFFLLKDCNALAVITDSKNSGSDTNGVRRLDMVERLPSTSHVDYGEVDAVKFQNFGDIWERHTFIIHSSGSTGMPKPIIHTNRSLMLIARMYRLFQEFSIENWFLLFPLYHIAGISIALSGLPNGQILSFAPLAWPPAASTIFTAWKTLSSMGYPVDCVHCAPTLIENMYEYIIESDGDFGPLASLKLLQPGGAVLSESIINDLTAHGVNVKTTYGSTEIGPPFRSIPHTRDNPKCYSFRNLYPDNPLLKMEMVGEGLFECVVYKGFDLAADLWQGKPDNEPYRTNDLFIQDPPGSGFYVMQGRKDDIIVHTNGENTSAGSLQLDVQNGSRMISKAVALGHSRPCVSLLVEVHDTYDPLCSSTEQSVWQVVESINAKYPQHSQIMRSMIHILPAGSKLPVTPKGNVKRREAQRIYAFEIARLYSEDFAPPKLASAHQELFPDFLRNLFASLSKTQVSTITDWTTLYDLGIDSRLALSLRSSLNTYLKTHVSISTIFENPSVAQLVSHFSPKSSFAPPRAIPSSTQTIERIISKLEFEFQTWPPPSLFKVYPPNRLETVLLTGATGSLGSSLLQTLCASPNVKTIYALVRGPNYQQRLHHALKVRGLDTSILNEGGKIKVLNFSMQDPLLGLDIEMYHKLAETVTVVLQNAWKMDFNKGIGEFEGDCIRSTMSLLRLSYAGRPKRFAFTSSISTSMGPSSPPSIPESPASVDATSALPTGYAQSKYIIERILRTASLPSVLNIPITLLRVGQLCGHTKTGVWNEDEWVPILLATSAHARIRALPVWTRGKRVDWVPVDVAAASISELLLLLPPPSSSKAGAGGRGGVLAVHNIVNPHAITWSSLVSMIQGSSLVGEDRLEEVDMREWVRRLNSLASSSDDHGSGLEVPGLRLLGFFEDMVGDESESRVFETCKSEGISSSLRGCGPVNSDLLEGNLKAWRDSGFLSQD